MPSNAHTPPRIVTLDILRGVAVMGILAMNALAFSMPEGAYFNPLVYGSETAPDRALWLFNYVFIDGKMRGLFSLLFGASMLLVIRAAEAKSEDPARIHSRRMAWLFAFGYLHLILIWWGDILALYAMIGAVAYLFRDFTLKALLIWIAILLAVDQVMFGGMSVAFLQLSSEAALPNADPEAVRNWAGMSSLFTPLTPTKLAQDLALYRGGYVDLVRDRIDKEALAPIRLFMTYGWETLAYMLMGMAGLRTGFLTGAWTPRRYARIALVCVGIGTLGSAGLAAVVVSSGYDIATLAAASFGGGVIFRFLAVVGYAAAIILLTRHGGALVERIAAAGRAAFSNYLATSIVMTTIFYGYGIGLYGHVSRTDLYILVIAIWALMLLWSKPWLDRFSYGPLEWLWRSLSRGALQPMRRAVRPAAAEA